MDQTTVPQSTEVPSNGTSGGTTGDAGTPTNDIQRIIAAEIAKVKSEIIDGVRNQSFRDAQAIIDKRFSSLEPSLRRLGTIEQTVTRLNDHFTTAAEADLDPDVRKQRDIDRRLAEADQRVQAANLQTHVFNAAFQVQRSLAMNSIGENDPRLAGRWDQATIEANPQAWATQMIQDIGLLARQDTEARYRAQAQGATEAEARRARQIEEQARATAANTQRTAGRVETAVPRGTATPPLDALAQLYFTDKKLWAQTVRANAKLAARGDITTADQLKV